MAEPDFLDDTVAAPQVSVDSSHEEDNGGTKTNVVDILNVNMRKVQSESALNTKTAPLNDCGSSKEKVAAFQQPSPSSTDEDDDFDVLEFIDMKWQREHSPSDVDCHHIQDDVNVLQHGSTTRSKAEDFDVLEFINLEWQKSLAVQLWHFLLGATALLDFLTAMASRPKAFSFTSILSGSRRLEPWHLVGCCWTWLGEHSNQWSICFSLLWAADSFVEAHRRRLQDVRERDRQRLLNLSDSASELTSETTVDTKENDWWRGSRGVYYRTIFRQLMLLPVGFYVVLSHGIRELYDPVLTDGEHHNISAATQTRKSNNVALLDKTYLSYSRASQSLIVALTRQVITTAGSITGQRVRLQAIERAKRVGIIALRRAVKNPFRFYRRANMLLRLVRWIKYLGPVFGTLNKLVGNFLDLLDKHQQRSAAKRASAARRKRLHQLSKEEQLEYCATFIQKTFRANQSRRKMRMIRLMRRDAEIVAAVKLQSSFRAALRRARARLKDKMLELQKLKEQSGTAEMSSKQRRRMYQLQEELKAETRLLLNEKLLLRPNTSFAVRWKILLVFAVLIEISILVAQPRIARHKDPATGKPMDIETYIDRKLVPTPVSKLPACRAEKHPPKKHFPLLFIGGVVRERAMLAEKTKATIPKPFYCSNAYAFLQVSRVVKRPISMGQVSLTSFPELLSIRAFTFLFCGYYLVIFSCA